MPNYPGRLKPIGRAFSLSIAGLALISACTSPPSTRPEKPASAFPAYQRLKQFSEIEAIAKRGTDYEIIARSRGHDLLLLAIHGGQTEPGTSELLAEIEKQLPSTVKSSRYEFKALKRSPDFDEGSLTDPWLHLTSHRFNEPELAKLAPQQKVCLSLHGFYGDEADFCLGGRNEIFRSELQTALSQERDWRTCAFCCGKYAGLQPENPANLCKDTGVQIEMGHQVRRRLLSDQEFRRRIASRIVNAIQAITPD